MSHSLKTHRLQNWMAITMHLQPRMSLVHHLWIYNWTQYFHRLLRTLGLLLAAEAPLEVFLQEINPLSRQGQARARILKVLQIFLRQRHPHHYQELARVQTLMVQKCS